MAYIYGDGSNSSINGPGASQLNPYFYIKKALVDVQHKKYFSQMSNTRNMPKHFGKKVSIYHYVRMLDDQNLNSQGIDAAGTAVAVDAYEVLDYADNVLATGTSGFDSATYNNSAAKVTLTTDTVAITASTGVNGVNTVDIWNSASTPAKIATLTRGTAEGGATETDTEFFNRAVAIRDNIRIVRKSGNLYGSSRDIGVVSGKFPVLGENGGRVNRVGTTRLQIDGTIAKFGFFQEYTQESMDFDSDAELLNHIITESVNGAVQISEDLIQNDLLNAAQPRYAGSALSMAQLQADTATVTNTLQYKDFTKAAIDLDKAYCDKNTTIIKGSRLIDTRTINAARYAYVGSELYQQILEMKDPFGNQAFISVEKYAAAGNIAQGEVGAIGQFRIIMNPQMLVYSGKGAKATNPNYYSTAGNYDVFPVLIVGNKSFSTIGFETDGKSVKFRIKHVPPEENHSTSDPYGETGFYSLKFYYGILIERPEWIIKILTTAKV